MRLGDFMALIMLLGVIIIGIAAVSSINFDEVKMPVKITIERR